METYQEHFVDLARECSEEKEKNNVFNAQKQNKIWKGESLSINKN